MGFDTTANEAKNILLTFLKINPRSWTAQDKSWQPAQSAETQLNTLFKLLILENLKNKLIW